MHFLDRIVNIMVKCSEQIVYCKTVYGCGWPPWTKHASTRILVYIRTDFEFDMQLPVCKCSISPKMFPYCRSSVQCRARVVSLARLLHNLRVEKHSGHMSQVTMAQGHEMIQYRLHSCVTGTMSAY